MTQGGPQFPDPFGIRQPLRPGATTHRAGLTLEQRIQALEQGALGRPGAVIANTAIPITNSAAFGRVNWIAYNPTVTVDARSTTGTATTVTEQVIRSDGAIVNYNASPAAQAIVHVRINDYLPDTTLFKLQGRVAGTFQGNTTSSAQKWGAGLWHVTTISGGAITAWTNVSALTYTSAAVAGNNLRSVQSPWSDITADRWLVAALRPENAASAAVWASLRIEVRAVAA